MKFPFTFFKGAPTDHVVKYVSGVRRKEGRGGIFFVGPRTTIARVSTTDVPVPFAFTELTIDGQQVVVQGEMQVRYLVDHILSRRDFTIDAHTGDYESDDPEKVAEEATHTLQTFVRVEVGVKTLKDMLAAAAVLKDAVFTAVSGKPEAWKAIGIEVASLFITGVTPANLDLKKALEAEAREKMLAAADKAVADRRRAAAESDRGLKEYEAETARTLEEKRAALVAVRNANTIAEAEADARAIDERLRPYRDMDAGTLLALGIREIGSSGRVGTFNVTPDLLSAVMAAGKNGSTRLTTGDETEKR